MDEKQPLLNRHALVTGASRGIGAAAAKRLAAMGAELTLVSRSQKALKDLSDELGMRHRRRFQVEVCDVTDPEAVRRVFMRARDVLGPVTVLVNNVGAVESAPFLKLPRERWLELIHLNLTSAVDCTREALPDMLDSGWGRVVNVASIAGVTGVPYVSAYVAAKHALIGFTRALATEVASKGLTVNAVCPGYVDTDLVSNSVASLKERTGKTEEELRQALIRHNPTGRMLTPDEVASSIAWLCHPDQAMVNGHALLLSGAEVF